MTDLFISYCHKDADRVRALVDGLKAARIVVWWDEDIPPKEDWELLIESKMREAGNILVVCTQGSVASREVRAEARYAIQTQKMLPVLLEEVDLPYRWAGFQFVALKDLPPQNNAQWPSLLEVARSRSLTQLIDDKADEAAVAHPRGENRSSSAISVDRERADGIVIPWEAVLPAVCVLASLGLALAGGMLDQPGIPWSLISAGALGAVAIAGALWNVRPTYSRRAA